MRFGILAACLIAACFLPVLLGSQTFFFRDYAIFSGFFALFSMIVSASTLLHSNETA